MKWPINLQYRLEILLERPHGESFTIGQQNTTQILNLDLSAKIKRVVKDNDSTEVASITLPAGDSLLNYNVIVKLSPPIMTLSCLSINRTTKVPKSIDNPSPRQCQNCDNTLLSRAARVCATCGHPQPRGPRHL